MPNRLRTDLRAILLGGLVAGTIDLGAAALINGLSPVTIMQAVASGLMGKAAFHGGPPVAALGMGLQWAMSLVIAAVYVIAARWAPILRRRWLAGGLAFGVGVFAVMNYVVMPLSAVGHAPHFTPLSFSENMLAMLLFGVIVAFFARGPANAA